MMRTGGGCDFITRIWTELVWVRSSSAVCLRVSALAADRERDAPGLQAGCLRKIKRVLGVAGGVVGGGVEGVEAMILVLDFRAVGDGEAELAEGANDVLGDLRERMEFAERAAASGQGEIGRFLGQRGLEFEFGAAFGERGFEFDLGGVDEFAGGGLFLLRERAELFHQRGELAVGAEPGALGLFERGGVGRRLEFGERGLFQRFNFVQERHIPSARN